MLQKSVAKVATDDAIPDLIERALLNAIVEVVNLTRPSVPRDARRRRRRIGRRVELHSLDVFLSHAGLVAEFDDAGVPAPRRR